MTGGGDADEGLQPLRALGPHETFEAIRYARKLFSNVATSAAYTTTSLPQGELQPLILHAMRRVVLAHAALSTVFTNTTEASTTKKPHYARLPYVDLRTCVVFETRKYHGEAFRDGRDIELDQLLVREHNSRFDDERRGPLWKLIVLRPAGDETSFVACFVYQHAIGDGNGGPSFHRTLLAELCALSREQGVLGAPPDPVVRSPDAALPASLEALYKLPLSPGFLLKMAWHDKFPTNSQSLWLAAPICEPTRSRFRSFSLTAALTTRLLAACRAHAVSMTAAVHALITNAIFTHIPAYKTQLKSTIAIDLRRFLPAGALEPDAMGNYVSTMYIDHKRPGATDAISWAEAQRTKALLDKEVRLGKNLSVGCLKWVSDFHKYFASKLGQPREASFCLTNLGSFKERGDGQGPWRTGRMVFSEAFDFYREAMDVTMVSGADGCLTLGLVWGDGVVEEDLVINIFETLRTLVVTTAEQASP